VSEKQKIIKSLTSEQRKILVERLASFLYEKERQEKRVEELTKI
jgi:hypothetical protein